MAPKHLVALALLLELGSGALESSGFGAPSENPAHSLSDAGDASEFGSWIPWRTVPVPFRQHPLKKMNGTHDLLHKVMWTPQLSAAVSCLTLVAVFSLLCLMFGGQGGGQGGEDRENPGSGSLRDPPVWNPNMERRTHKHN